MKARQQLGQALNNLKSKSNLSKNERENIEYLNAFLNGDKRTVRRIKREIAEEEEIQRYIDDF